MPWPSVGQQTLTSTILNPYNSLSSNPIINGGMEIWQRGTTLAGFASGNYLADRWSGSNTSAAVITISQAVDVPAVAALIPQSTFSLAMTIPTTADNSIAAGDLFDIYQPIEGYNWNAFAQKQVTVGFWIKAHTTGIYCVSLRNSTPNQSCIVEYTVNVADTWEYKTATFPPSGVVSVANGWNITNGVGVYLTFSIAAGSTFQTTAGSWQAGNFVATSNQVNGISATTSIFKLWGVTINSGPIVQPYWPRSYPIELALCQRYYTRISGNSIFVGTGRATTTNNAYIYWKFPVSMRIAPSGTNSTGSFAAGNVSGVANLTASSGGAGFVTTDGVLNLFTTAAGFIAGNGTEVLTNGAGGMIEVTGTEL